MKDETYDLLCEDTLSWLRQQDNIPVTMICLLVGAADMGTFDAMHTAREVRDYVESGDAGAARALLQHAKGRRERWHARNKSPQQL